MEPDLGEPTSSLRARFRESERETSRLRLLEASCLAVAEESDQRRALRAALSQAMRFLTADAGVVLRYESGGLVVQASEGPMLPPGARVAAAGALGAALKGTLQVRENAVSPLRVGSAPAAALEILVPLRLRTEVRGLLALSSSRPIARPDAADMATLQALAAVLGAAVGAALEERGVPRATRASRRDAVASLTLLTRREQQVLALLPRGLSNAEMAEQLGIATGTAKVHVERILHKLGLKHRTQAAVRAIEWGVGK